MVPLAVLSGWRLSVPGRTSGGKEPSSGSSAVDGGLGESRAVYSRSVGCGRETRDVAVTGGVVGGIVGFIAGILAAHTLFPNDINAPNELSWAFAAAAAAAGVALGRRIANRTSKRP